MKHPITQFRIVAFAEGLSYLVLLGIAMPMKYLLHQEWAVRLVGSIHGGLFILFVITLFRAAQHGRWSWGRSLEAFVASLLPFGTFYLEYKYQQDFASQAESASE